MQRQETVEGLVKLREIWASTGWNVTLATCAEDIDLTVMALSITGVSTVIYGACVWGGL